MKFAPRLIGLVSVALAGCSSLPAAGPTTSKVLDQAVRDGQRRFDIVDVDTQVVNILRAQPKPSFKAIFQTYGKPPTAKIGIGDTLSVSIWEAASGGLFGGGAPAEAPTAAASAPGGAHNVSIPDQVVMPDGAISVPYAGRVPAAGRTPLQVQQEIQQRLADRAIEPQAIVTISKSVSDVVTVSGEVTTGAVVPLSVRGGRLLEVIAAAGGAKAPIYDTFVRLSRHGITTTVPMDTLVSDPAENIYVWPDDVVTVIQRPQTFTAFGATTNNWQLPFNSETLNLAQAIAKAGGLQDLRADPSGVFLFRFEPPTVVKALGVPPLVNTPDGKAAVLYHLDFRDAAAYFLAERFPIADNDMIYVANAPLTELQKFFTLVNTITGPVISGVVVSRSVGGS